MVCAWYNRADHIRDTINALLAQDFPSFEIIIVNDGSPDPRVREKEMLGILRDRRMKFPKKLPNCGSVFVSNPAMYASYAPPGKVIEQAGFKGRRVGGMQVSDMHANFIVNLGEGRATEALELINQIRSKVKQNTGYEMAVEVRYVTPSGDVKQI